MPINPNDIDLSPEIIWGKPGFLQQGLFWALTVIIWSGISIYSHFHPDTASGLIAWQGQIKPLFNVHHIGNFLLWGIIIGTSLSIIFALADILISIVSGKNWYDSFENLDLLLPNTQKTKKNAAIIVISGSVVEEILFRGFLFFALMPLWTHWLWAAILVSAIFALIHTNLQGFSASLWIFSISMILIIVILQTHSLVFCAVIHTTVNYVNIFIFPKITGGFR